jgi:hypothetical protein
VPAVWIFANPGRGRKTRGSKILSSRCYAVEYRHHEDGKNYRHDYTAGVTIEALPDGSLRMFRTDGRPVIRDF